MPKAAPTLRQRKVFALTRILGGLVAAFYLGYVVIANLAAGLPFDNKLMFTALVAAAGFGYAAWYLRDLSAVAREEREQGVNGNGGSAG
ncbi:hypothetical protein [Aromatoleum evansii]|uniref:DUF4229 domain-containing protein n=1 Tax=Aromatoleum evansii TaxID=59406 RepID=A0ABZ1APY6_AROEV|nr:hypothetical protein [Aromatoleum evansii]NMG29391.1 hypothetical protein [Aromatoleum evansii]WRL46183.1 hypothetical protein U5817_23780 [Aromatoleum evansii]